MIRSKRRPPKTIEDYLGLPDDVRVELIDGEFFMSPSPKERHQRIVSNIHFALRSFVQAGHLGRIYDAPLDVHLPSGDIVQPDVFFISDDNKQVIQDWIRGAPDLAVEVLSPETPERDRIVKRELYARNGIREYWLVDGDRRSVEVFALSGVAYQPYGYFEADEVLQSAVLAGLALPLPDIFAE